MLISVDSFEKLDFPELMEVYIREIKYYGEDVFPDQLPEWQLKLAIDDFRQYLQEQFCGTAGAVYWIWEESGQYVSALFMEAHKDGVLFRGPVTHPGYRRMGYAKKLVSAVLEQLPTGTKVYTYVAKGDSLSQKTYLSRGFSKTLDQGLDFNGMNSRYSITMEITL